MITAEDELLETWLTNVYSAQRPSEQLRHAAPVASVAPGRNGRTRPALNLLAGLVGFLVVAAGVALAAVELANHHDAGAASSQPAKLATLPSYGPGALPKPVQVLVPLTRGNGDAELLPFTPDEPYYVQLVCSGPGTFRFESLSGFVSDTVQHCDGAVTTVEEPHSPVVPAAMVMAVIAPTTFRVTAQPSTSWAIIVVQKGSSALGPLGTFGLPAHGEVLIPETKGSGSVTLPAFTPTKPYYVSYLCSGTFGPFDITSADGAVHYISYGCGSAVGGAVIDPTATQILGKPVVLHIVAPQKLWEIEVVQGVGPTTSPTPIGTAIGFSLPQGAKALLPLTFGTGTTSLKAFLPTGYWFLETVCTGSGSLRIVSATGMTLSRVACGGMKYGAVLGSEQSPPTSSNPQRVTVQADPTSTWIVLAYQP